LSSSSVLPSAKKKEARAPCAATAGSVTCSASGSRDSARAVAHLWPDPAPAACCSQSTRPAGACGRRRARPLARPAAAALRTLRPAARRDKAAGLQLSLVRVIQELPCRATLAQNFTPVAARGAVDIQLYVWTVNSTLCSSSASQCACARLVSGERALTRLCEQAGLERHGPVWASRP